MRTAQKPILRSVPNTEPEIAFTAEMVEAGVKKLLKYDIEEDNEEIVVRAIFADMYRLYVSTR